MKTNIMNNTITAKADKKGQVVRPYKNGVLGYVVVESKEQVMNGGWIKEVTRTALIKGKIALLEALVKAGIPGRIAVREYLESDIPANMETYLDMSQDHDDRIDQFIKRAGEDGPELTIDGERIVRFSIWDATGKMEDILLTHDNMDEVAEWRKANREANA
jgi:hypothetical protein